MQVFKKLVSVALLGVLISFFSTAAYARVLSTYTKTINQENGESYKAVFVRCAAFSDPRVIFKDPANQGHWCSKQIPGAFCHKKKLSAANSICTVKYKKELAKAQESAELQAQENIKIKAQLEQEQEKIKRQIEALQVQKRSVLEREAALEIRELELKQRLAKRQ